MTLKKIVIISILFIFSFCAKNPDFSGIEQLSIYSVISGIPEVIETRAFNNSIRLTSLLGQFHWRGLYYPVNVQPGNFHSSEDGDGTAHTGQLLGAMAWRYRYFQDAITKNHVNNLLRYFELMIAYNNGCLGRNFVIENAYQLFPFDQRDGISDGGQHMRYRIVNIDGNQYRLRYDVSQDQMAHAYAGLYWVWKFIPEYKIRVKNIMTQQLAYYTANAWLIKDTNGDTVEFGDHSPVDANPIMTSVQIILNYISNDVKINRDSAVVVMNNVSTYLPGTSLNKISRPQFNNYMIIAVMHVIWDIGYPVSGGIKRLYDETDGESNLYNVAIYKDVADINYLTMKDLGGVVLQDYYPVFYLFTEYPIFWNERHGYNWWEVSAYRRTVFAQKGELIGNESYLQAYWLFR